VNDILDQLSMSNAILVNGAPEVMLLTIDLYEDFVGGSYGYSWSDSNDFGQLSCQYQVGPYNIRLSVNTGYDCIKEWS
jgi:hypothetical protein